MPTITFLPHPELCPDGVTIEADTGESVLDIALNHGVALEHACDKSCACTTCHIIIREGFDSLTPATEQEEDLLDKAWGLEAESRLGCQAKLADENLVVEIPKYTINYARENH
ncbi:ferredoxin, 2Fe-2S type, ISC system [Beggiatoa alba B18LD]|uniref:2Fe-2S ferredoxin n=1 Tax=Beggiatoa alba B18LD TaxID=395493 RepID=I3CI46_9GAMM|nr:ISC system 2Fe-2S type ferredoxin [Beggiatoa alba]EIJ43289.1 ferredoxin, 2Fe-2S type, ISC system [Beggiatoa alba B18LD]